MMPTKDSDTPVPYYLLGSQGCTPNRDSLSQVGTVLSQPNKPASLQSDSHLHLQSRPTSSSQTQNSYSNSSENRQRTNMDYKANAGYSSSGDSSSNNNSMAEGVRANSGRRADPVEVHQMSQDCSFNSGGYEDDEGLSVIPPSPERPHGPLLGTRSPLTKNNPGSGDNSLYGSCVEGVDRQMRSPSWQTSRQAHMHQREIPRRITFSQESLEHTPAETRESLTSFAQHQMSPDKALKRGHYSSTSNSDEGDSKKRKTGPPVYDLDTYKIRSPYGESSNRARPATEAASSNSILTPTMPVPSFADRLKFTAALTSGSQMSDQRSLPSPHPFTAYKDHCSLVDSDPKLSGADSWTLHLSESQHSQSQSPVIEDHQVAYPPENVSHLPSASYQKRSTAQDDFDRHHKSSSHTGQKKTHRLVDRARQMLYTEKKSSTPCQYSSSEENTTPHSKKLPPLVLQISHASTITPTSLAATPSPSCHSSSQLSQGNTSSLAHDEQPQDKVLVDSTETSAIFHQMSTSSSNDTSLYESGLSLSKNAAFDVLAASAGLHQKPSDLSAPPQQPAVHETLSATSPSKRSSDHRNTDMLLEGHHHKQHHAAATGVALTEPSRSSKSKGKLLFSPEVASGSGAILKQKRPHSDEEFVRNVRPTCDFSSQADIPQKEDSLRSPHRDEVLAPKVRPTHSTSSQTDQPPQECQNCVPFQSRIDRHIALIEANLMERIKMNKVAALRPTCSSSSQNDQPHEDLQATAYEEKGSIVSRPTSAMSGHGVSTYCRIRDAHFRYRETLSGTGVVLHYDLIAIKEKFYTNTREEELPPLLSQSLESTRGWSSLTSGEMGDVSSSILSSKSASSTSLPSVTFPNSMSQLPQRRHASKEGGSIMDRHSNSMNTQSSTSSAFSGGTAGASQDNDYLFVKPMDPGGHSLTEKEAAKSDDTTPGVPAQEEEEKLWASENAPTQKEEEQEDKMWASEETPEPNQEEDKSVVNTPIKKSPGRTHKKGAKRSPMSKRKTPKSGSLKKKLSSGSSNTSSPEVPPSLVKESPVKADNSTIPGQFYAGMQVMARWRDCHFYSGTLAETDPSGKWEVNFEDGSQRCVREVDILDEAMVVKGQSVLALSPDGYYDPGILQGRYWEDNHEGFIVDLDKGFSIRCKRGTVILSSDQASPLLRRHSFDRPVASLSLDNIVDGKRRRTPKSFADNGTPPLSSRPMATRALGILPQPPPLLSTRRRTRPDPNLQSSDYNSTVEDNEKSERPSLIPRLKLQRSKKDPDRYQCSDMETEEVSKQLTKVSVSRSSAGTDDERSSKKGSPTKSPKKSTPTKAGSAEVEYGPFPLNNDIFHGLYFLISCSERSANQQMRKQFDSGGSDIDVNDNIDVFPHLDREHVSLQIQKAGGIVLESFEETESVPKKQVLLISNTHLRTIKYLKCLAAGIPCICVSWVNTCCQKNKRLKYDGYVLPAGYSIVDGQIVNWHKRSNSTLCDMRVMLWSEKNPDFVPFWTPVLLAAQASMVAKPVESKQPVSNFDPVDVVVSDPSLPPHIARRFRELKVPVVSSEWVIQCIITGKRQLFNGHPKFEHAYTDD